MLLLFGVFYGILPELFNARGSLHLVNGIEGMLLRFLDQGFLFSGAVAGKSECRGDDGC